MLEAGHGVANDFSRKYWIVTWNPDSRESQQILNETAAELRSGETEYVIVEKRTENAMIGELNTTYIQNYCSDSSIDSGPYIGNPNIDSYYYCNK
jgi:hypothetical protein